MEQERSTLITVLITTSRNPSHFLRQVSKILSLSIPRSEKITRGSLNKNQIFNYCINRNIKRLIILQRSNEGNSARARLFSNEGTIHSCNSDIVLSDIISLKKHDRNKRLAIRDIKINFSEDTKEEVKKQIINYFKPIMQKDIHDREEILLINFKQENSDKLIGYAFQNSSRNSQLLYKINLSYSSVKNGN